MYISHFKLVVWILVSIFILFATGCLSTIHSNLIHKDFTEDLKADNQWNDKSFNNRPVNMKYNEPQNLLAIGYESGIVKIWDTKSKDRKFEFKAHKNRANELIFSSDGSALFTNSHFEESVKIWNTHSGELIYEIPNVRGPVGLTPNKNVYIVASSGGARLFDYDLMYLYPEVHKTNGTITSIAKNNTKNLIATGTASGAIEVWKYSENNSIPTLEKISNSKPYSDGNWVRGLAFSSLGGYLYSVSRHASFDKWIPNDLKNIQSTTTASQNISSTSFLIEKNMLLTAAHGSKLSPGYSGFVQVLSLDGKEKNAYLSKGSVNAIEFLPSTTSSVLVSVFAGGIRVHPLQEK